MFMFKSIHMVVQTRKVEYLQNSQFLGLNTYVLCWFFGHSLVQPPGQKSKYKKTQNHRGLYGNRPGPHKENITEFSSMQKLSFMVMNAIIEFSEIGFFKKMMRSP